MTDERRKLIAEAAEAHDGEVWRVSPRKGAVISIGPDDITGEVAPPGCDDKDAQSIALSHNAIPAAAELIEICEAANAELADRGGYSMATIAEQAKEIDRLKAEGASAEAEVNDLDQERVFACVWAMKAEDRAEKAEATIAEQAEEIERLNKEVAYLAHISGRG